ncbi:MAG: hypothetical protein ACK5W9_09955 [Bdellovibrionales bacterium]
MSKLICLIFISLSASATPVQELEKQALQSIKVYFNSSNRSLKQLRWVDLSLINRQNREYLVEAEALAQKTPISQSLALYHCGVFTRHVGGSSWETNLTTCEAFGDYPVPQSK